MKISYGGKNKTIHGTKWTIRWEKAADLVGSDNVGKAASMDTTVYVRDKDKNEKEIIAKKSQSVTIPKPLDKENFTFELENKDKIDSTEKKFPGKATIKEDSDDFETQF